MVLYRAVSRNLKVCGGKNVKQWSVLNILFKSYSTNAQLFDVEINTECITKEKSEYEWKNAIPYKNVPGPKPVPLLGNTWRFAPFIGDYQIEHMDKIFQRLYIKYGSIVKVSGLLGRPDMLFLYNPDEIERVFRMEDIMPHRPSMPSLNYYKHVLRKDFFGDNAGVIAVHGENWHNFRQKVQQVVLQPRVAKRYIGSIEEAANAFVERAGEIRDVNKEMPDDFLNYIHKWSLESIAQVALDVRLGCLDAEANSETQTLIDAVNTFFKNISVLELKFPFWKLFSTPTWRSYIQALDTITGISMKNITKALKNQNLSSNEEPSIVQRMLALDPDPKTACILALDLFLVGIDTTSNAVASILYQLSLHPEKQEKLYEEINRILPTRDTPVTAEKLNQMSYLKACIKETLRMYPVVIGNGRCTTKDCVISGYQIPKGVQVLFQNYVISNLDQYFTNSKEFTPERWLKSYRNANESHHPFASIPFGHGRRMCLGRRFADLEMQIVIAKMVQAYKLEYHHKELEYYTQPMFTPNGPLRLKLIDRK